MGGRFWKDFLEYYRDTEATKTFLSRLVGEYNVPEVTHTDQLQSYGAEIREIPSLIDVDHQQVILTARCNNLVEQRAGVHPGVRSAQDNRTEVHGVRSDNNKNSNGGNERKNSPICTSKSAGKRPHGRCSAQDSNLHHHTRTSVSATNRRQNQ
ncbi:DDE-type integrase/transposase/recombinase [Deinococcus detaillensis]|uniref:DDE-type integrase/transposase/recombinase n=1 Tax=Deinococcus detaillensis TaxID=2592048 RepID=UPI00384EA977